VADAPHCVLDSGEADGFRGISFILSSIVFHVIPTALEITMVCGILVSISSCFALSSAAQSPTLVDLEVRLGLRSCDSHHDGLVHLVHCDDNSLAVSAASLYSSQVSC
jgi:hypothetical protein